jgi:hypothetical protein
MKLSILLMLSMLLYIRNRDVRAWPQMAEVADGEADGHAHLGGHHDDGHVPAEAGDNEEEGTASLA